MTRVFTTACYATMCFDERNLARDYKRDSNSVCLSCRGLSRGARVAFASRLCGIHFPLVIVSATRERKRVIIPTLKCTTIYYVRIDI